MSKTARAICRRRGPEKLQLLQAGVLSGCVTIEREQDPPTKPGQFVKTDGDTNLCAGRRLSVPAQFSKPAVRDETTAPDLR
jgi:hypothetical protein